MKGARGPKSRALAAAASSTDDDVDVVPARWTRAMVERAIMVFSEIDRVPEYDDERIFELVRDFLRFAKRVERGGVDDDARALADAGVARGRAWLLAHPRYAPFQTRPWSVEMIEQLIVWFNDTTTSPTTAKDKGRLFEVVERFHLFERIVKNGAVDVDAEPLAHAFLDYGRRWLAREPRALAHYHGM